MGNYVVKVMGLAVNFSDIIYFPCLKGVYIFIFLCNQTYLLTYYHPLIHLPLYVIRKIIARRAFDNVRRKVKRCVDRIWKAFRRMFICEKWFQKC